LASCGPLSVSWACLILDNEEAVTTLEHIREEEKEHFAKLLGLIQRFDPAQADKL
jgi:hypothetical protein